MVWIQFQLDSHPSIKAAGENVQRLVLNHFTCQSTQFLNDNRPYRGQLGVWIGFQLPTMSPLKLLYYVYILYN
jgi:hypothetical protein